MEKSGNANTDPIVFYYFGMTGTESLEGQGMKRHYCSVFSSLK